MILILILILISSVLPNTYTHIYTRIHICYVFLEINNQIYRTKMTNFTSKFIVKYKPGSYKIYK